MKNGLWVMWAWVVVLLLGGGRAAAQDLPVAGDEGHLWVLRAGAEVPGETLVLHRGAGDPVDRIEVVETLTGLLRPNGVAAFGPELWLVYSDGSMRSMRAEFVPTQRAWMFEEGTYRPLPAGAELRGFAVGEDGPWALARMTDREAAAVLAPVPASRDEARTADAEERELRQRNLALGLPPGYRRAGEGGGEDTGAGETPDVEAGDDAAEAAPALEAADAVERDYLLRLTGSRWRVEALPEGWSLPDESWLVMQAPGSPTAAWPTLVSRTTAGLVVHTWAPEERAWAREAYALPGAGGAVRPLAVAGQVVVAQEEARAPLRVAVRALRSGRVIEVGSLEAPGVEGGGEAGDAARWGVAAAGLSVALVVLDPDDVPATPAAEEVGAAEGVLSSLTGEAPAPLGLQWTRLDLSGDVVQPVTPLERAVHHPLENRADYAVMLAIAGLAMLMLMVFWRRDPSWTQLALPDDLVLAELPRRALAGAIDFAPAVLIVMEVYNLGFVPLLQDHWPGAVSSFEALVPGAIAIAIFVAHTLVAELFGGRSLGKMVTGLRVVDLNGRRPRAWQVVVRNLLKAFDLIAPLLLVLPAIGLLRQRLGDLMARTVVVVPRGDEDGDDASKDHAAPGDAPGEDARDADE